MTEEREWYLYLGAFRSRSRSHDPRWIEGLRAGLDDALWPRVLDSSGELNDIRGRRIGRYQLFEVAEAEARWGGAPWFTIDPPCPFVGPVSGFVSWEPWMNAEMERDFAKDMLWATRGYLARTDRADRFEAIVEEDFPLANAEQKHGFHDGDFFFEEDGAYPQYVRDKIVATVEALGLRPELFNGGTGHNPHRIDQFVPRANQTYATCWETFNAHADDLIRLWGYNWTGIGSKAFEEFLAPPG